PACKERIMPWIIGIDEAGYGPNLGPLVMSCVAFRAPEPLVGTDLWSALGPAVRRCSSEEDGGVLVDDSKLVYTTAKGLEPLEMSVLAVLRGTFTVKALTLSRLLKRLACGDEQPPANPWYTGRTRIPVSAQSRRR